ncbi:DUF2059 domain-containing protein [Psychrobacter alimentarius]|uniref:DUF2059 domain-containing protein n=1 Tax=Psychrobacter alimentarius TaxID=261164 RepID=UPI001918FE7A|nr:DUF2059 domain-containing protein [Psychrobacter alimentarius]
MTSLLKSSAFAITLSVSAMTAMVVPTLSAQAAVPTDASLMKLIKVTKIVETMNDMSSDNEMTEEMMKTMLASMPNNELNAAQRKRFDEIILKYSKEMTKRDNVEGINKQIVNMYMQSAKKHFDQKEVDAQIEFYSTEVGQSIIDKQPAMMKDYMAQIMPIIMESTMKKMQEVMPKMAADLKALTSEK